MAGAPPEVLEQLRACMPDASDEDFEVWPENWECLNLFLALDGDWNIAIGMSAAVYQGLSTPAIESIFNIFKIAAKKRIEYLAKLKAMQHAALPFLNKSKD